MLAFNTDNNLTAR